MSKHMYILAVLLLSICVGTSFAAISNGWRLPTIPGYWDDANNWTRGHLPTVDTNDYQIDIGGGEMRTVNYTSGEEALLGGYFGGNYFDANSQVGPTGVRGHAIIRKNTQAWGITVGCGALQGFGELDIMPGVQLDVSGITTGGGSSKDTWGVVNMYGGIVEANHPGQWSRLARYGTSYWNQYGGIVNMVMNYMAEGDSTGYINIYGGQFNTWLRPVPMFGKVYVNVSQTGIVNWQLWPITGDDGTFTYPYGSAGIWFTLNGAGKLIFPGNLTDDVNMAAVRAIVTSKSNIIATYPSPTVGGDNTEFTTDACGAIPTGDFNMDCIVNFEDYALMSQNWLKP